MFSALRQHHDGMGLPRGVGECHHLDVRGGCGRLGGAVSFGHREAGRVQLFLLAQAESDDNGGEVHESAPVLNQGRRLG